MVADEQFGLTFLKDFGQPTLKCHILNNLDLESFQREMHALKLEDASKQEATSALDHISAHPSARVSSTILDLARHVHNGAEMSRETLAAALEIITNTAPGPAPPDEPAQEDDGVQMDDASETPQLAVDLIPAPCGKENRRRGAASLAAGCAPAHTDGSSRRR